MVTVNPDILVETVGANVSILITVRNVEVNAIVMKTPVTFKLDVQMSPKVLYHTYNMFLSAQYLQ